MDDVKLRGTPEDKYETKRSGLTCDEALEAAVLGYRVRCASIPANAVVLYEFKGWRLQFVHDGRDGSSCDWSPTQYHWLEPWEVVPYPPEEPKRDSWGKPIVERTWDDVMSDKVRTEGGWRDKPTKDKWGQ